MRLGVRLGTVLTLAIVIAVWGAASPALLGLDAAVAEEQTPAP